MGNEALGDEVTRVVCELAAALSRTAELEALIERTIFALNLGGNGTLEEAKRVSRDYGNQMANLYLDLCAAMGRGHRAALRTPDREGRDG